MIVSFTNAVNIYSFINAILNVINILLPILLNEGYTHCL